MAGNSKKLSSNFLIGLFVVVGGFPVCGSCDVA